MTNQTILKFSPRKPRAVEIHTQDIERAIDLIAEIVIKKIKDKEETGAN